MKDLDVLIKRVAESGKVVTQARKLADAADEAMLMASKRHTQAYNELTQEIDSRINEGTAT